MILANPMEDGCNGDKCEEGGSELIVASGNASMAFESAEEVFDPMPASVETSMERTFLPALGRCRQAREDAQLIELDPQGVGVVALVAEHGRTASRIDLCKELRSF